MPNQYTESATWPADLILERRRFVVECRRKAMIWDAIEDAVAAKFGRRVSAAMCFHDFKYMMDKRNAEVNEDLDSIRQTMADQIDRLLLKSLERAESGDVDHVDACIKLLARKAKLLGADAPTKIQDDRLPQVTAGMTPAALLERIDAIRNRLSSKLSGAIDVGPRYNEPEALPSSAVLEERVSEEQHVEHQHEPDEVSSEPTRGFKLVVPVVPEPE